MLNSFYKICRFFLSFSKGSIIWPFIGKGKVLIVLPSCFTTSFLRCVKMVATMYCPSSFFLIKYFVNQSSRNFSPNSSRCTAAISETFVPTFFVSAKPFIQSSTTPLYQLKYLVVSVILLIQLYRFIPFFIFFLIFHRLLLQNCFWRKLRRCAQKFTMLWYKPHNNLLWISHWFLISGL